MGGVPIGYTKSEFYQLSSSGPTDFVPIDLSGAREVVFKCTAFGGKSDAQLCKEPTAGSDKFTIPVAETAPLVVHSTDDRLFFVAREAAGADLDVWIIRG